MLPASLIADCSSSPKGAAGLFGRRSISGARRMAVGCGNTSSVRPVRSPIICISTATIGSSSGRMRDGTSSSAAIVIVGTVIMIVLSVICESAVAACPEPMFAVSRSASRSSLSSRSKSAIERSLVKTAYVHDQRRRAIGQNRGPAEQCESVAHTVESLHDDVLLTGELVDHESRDASVALDHDHLRDPVDADEPPLRQTYDLPELLQRHDLVAQQHHFPPLHAPTRV